MNRPVSLSVIHKNTGSLARAGVLHTPHGEIYTPTFVAVGTKANVKGVLGKDLAGLGVQSVIVNTYHLYLSGLEAVKVAGGLHAFMGFNGPLMTDSGGFQVFSLGSGFGKKVSKFNAQEVSHTEGVAHYDEEVASEHGKLAIVDDDGVTFTSHVNGTLHRFTPERSVELQHELGADIFFAFDQCTAPNDPYDTQRDAMKRTHAWAKRSLAAHRRNIEANNKQAIYGIGQGGQFDDLRRESARTIGDMGFDGFGLGGSFSRKYGEHSLQSALAMLRELPADMPVHGLGVGEPEDLLLGIEYGVDTFDCVTPTRNGRTGGIYTSAGKIQIPNAQYAQDFSMLDERCGCFVCEQHTKAYVHHLFRTHEMLGCMLASMHNIYFLTNLVAKAREAILDNHFSQYREEFLAHYTQR